MPCEQYELQLKNSVVAPGGDVRSAVAELDPSTSTVLALQHGHTNIVLDHKSILLSYVCVCVFVRVVPPPSMFIT